MNSTAVRAKSNALVGIPLLVYSEEEEEVAVGDGLAFFAVAVPVAEVMVGVLSEVSGGASGGASVGAANIMPLELAGPARGSRIGS